MLMVHEKDLFSHCLALAEQEWGPPKPKSIDNYLREMVEDSDAKPEVINGTWYIVVVEPQNENIASAGLIARRFATYFPQKPKSIKANYHKRRVVMRPMLPGYVLTSFDVGKNDWKRINSVPGVRRILMVEERPVPVPETALHFIRKEEMRAAAEFGTRKRQPMPCGVGAWVQIVEHFSFTGFFGQVTQLLAQKEKLVLHLDLFGRQTPVEVSVNQVRVV